MPKKTQTDHPPFLLGALGPGRYLRLQALLPARAVVFVVPGCIAAGGLFLILGNLVQRQFPHHHDGYVPTRVQAVMPMASDSGGFRMSIFTELPEGGRVIAMTNSLALAQTVVETTCLERRGDIRDTPCLFLAGNTPAGGKT